MEPRIILSLYVLLFLLQFVWERILDILNLHYSDQQKNSIPDFIKGLVTLEDYQKSIEYTRTNGKFNIFSSIVSSIFLLLLILSGCLGFIDTLVASFKFDTYTHGVVFILIIILIFRLFSLPFSLYSQFTIEERFGFNKMTPSLFFMDLLKSLVISLVLFVPLLYLLFFFMDKTGNLWWLYAFGIFTLFQFFMNLIYPTVIVPLFNKLSPLEPGTLRDKIYALAEKLRFKTKDIFVIDGSKRSGHSNAYFTGIGKTKRIVLYDTLINSLEENSLVAVLAHEIGHEKKHHNKKTIVLSLIGSLLGFFIISLLLQFPPFFEAFGFDGPSYHAVLILLMFCSGPFTFFLSPVLSILSRKYEYEADRFAVTSIQNTTDMKDALISLHKNNLSNLTPHPLYSFYHYSHPTLAERIKAIDEVKI
ncbi:MAG: M48 family metallopeptidase [Candidatus Pacearchaeota archaeon]|nr:M48 family metallopeptidase [Candidatus Pacearchaeota archaeon]